MEEEMKVLSTGNSEEKIEILEKLASTENYEIIQKIIECLDDPDIKVRGEAFSSLILNKKNISIILIKSLKDSRKNIRGFGCLVLANRNDTNAIPAIMELVKDKISMVRACALGALGHLKAKQAKSSIHSCILDTNMEVRKSALHAMINLDEKISEEEFFEILKEKDPEIEQLVIKLKNGPEGI